MNPNLARVTLLAALTLAACGGGGGGSNVTPKPKPTPQLGTLIKDINTDTMPVSSLSRSGVGVRFQGKLYFAASLPATGLELFVSDGTVAGTKLFFDIEPGATSSSPTNLRVSGSFLFFTARTSAHSAELWRTDGTAAGTQLVKDIRPGVLSANPQQLTDLNGKLVFQANDGVNGVELWVSDGSTAGTTMVRDIYTGKTSGGSPYGSSPNGFAVLGGYAYFSANSAGRGFELWRTDGTSAGTTLVREIWGGATSSSPVNLTVMSGRIYFTASTSGWGREMWSTDGTSSGTRLVRDLRSGKLSSSPHNLTVVNGILYFAAYNTTGTELYKTDGSSAGTVLVRDINTQSAAASSSPARLFVVGAQVFFRATDGKTGSELWATNGTRAGTRLVKDIHTGSSSSSPDPLFTSGGELVFAATDATNGRELWVTDGTSGGTRLLSDYNPTRHSSGTPNGSAARFIGALGSTNLLAANNGTQGTEPLFAHGLRLEPANLAAERGAPSYSQGFAELGVLTVFAANGGAKVGDELWATDGTANGTGQVLDIHTGAGNSQPREMTELNGQAVFVATTAGHGRELWTTDGTAAGTKLLADLYPGFNSSGTPYSSSPIQLTRVGDNIVFRARSPKYGSELFVTDGTTSGTKLLRDIYSGTASSNPSGFVAHEGVAWFSARHPTYGYELWRTDGTTSGTYQVRNINTGAASSYPNNLFLHDGTIYFAAYTATTGYELWISDGKSAGTRMLRDLDTGTRSSSPSQFVAVGGTVYFVAQINNRPTLHRTDGTPAGTRSVATLDSIYNLRVFAGGLWFTGRSPEQGYELWKSDGTAAGTVIVRDFYAGPAHGSPGPLVTVDDKTAWFIATDAKHGRELWQITPDGTIQLARDFFPGAAAGASAVHRANGVVFAVADDGKQGAEPWVVQDIR